MKLYYFKRVKNGEILSVESKSVNHASPNFIEATKTEFDAFTASLPEQEPVIQRDLAKELDGLKAELQTKGVIG